LRLDVYVLDILDARANSDIIIITDNITRDRSYHVHMACPVE